MLSKIAADFAHEIASHDWSDAPFRTDRAGHQRSSDGAKRTERVLNADESERVRVNVVFVAAQVLASQDPNFDPWEFARAAGVRETYLSRSDGRRNKTIWNGLRPDDFEVSRDGSR